MDKVPIELNYTDAIRINIFLQHMKTMMENPLFAALKDAIDNYDKEVSERLAMRRMELTPYDALAIHCFLEEMKYELMRPSFAKLKKAADNYKRQIFKHVTEEQVDDAEAERAVNQLLNKQPV